MELTVMGLATVLGPIILLVALIWVIARNRQSKIPKEVTERATDANYEAEDQAAKNRDI